MDNLPVDSTRRAVETQSRLATFQIAFVAEVNALYANGRHQVRIDILVRKESRTRPQGNPSAVWGNWTRQNLSAEERQRAHILDAGSGDLPPQWTVSMTHNGFDPGVIPTSLAPSDEESIVSEVQQADAYVVDHPETVTRFLSTTVATNVNCMGRITLDHPNDAGRTEFFSANILGVRSVPPLRIHASTLQRTDSTLIEGPVPWQGDFWGGKDDWWSVGVAYFDFPPNTPRMRERHIESYVMANRNPPRRYFVFEAAGNIVRGLITSPSLRTVEIRTGNRSNVQQAHNRQFHLRSAAFIVWEEYDNFEGYIRTNRVENGRIRIIFTDAFGNLHIFIIDRSEGAPHGGLVRVRVSND